MKTVDMTDVYADLGFLLQHIERDQESAVKRWSSIPCEDYQVPLALLSGLLIDLWLAKGKATFPIRAKPEYHALAEIVRRSHLAELLVINEQDESIRLHSHVSQETLDEVAQFVTANTSGCE